MTKKILSTASLAFFLLTCGYAIAGPGKPNFSPSVYADGIAWGTKGTTGLPAPNDHNIQSYDILYVFTNGADGQLPVSDAGPRNPFYNGGRWFTHTAEWNIDNPPVVKSYHDIMMYVDTGDLDIWPGSPGGPPDFFQCPLLPVKEW
jgi:hypothetical protein